MTQMANGPQDIYAVGLELQLNGHKKRFVLDSGASGLLISRSAAASAGIVGEAESRVGGVGDKGLAKASLAHVDSLRIGELEFHNCLVQVAESRETLDVDGLIGPDVFSSWVVTLDIPAREVRLTPLPKRPDEAAQTSELDTAGAGENTQLVPRDRYIAPEMKDWTPVFRYGHLLIFPTTIGKAPQKLFIMDTGAFRTTVSPSAAREVTDVGGSDMNVKGVNGEVKDVKQPARCTSSSAASNRRFAICRPSTLPASAAVQELKSQASSASKLSANSSSPSTIATTSSTSSTIPNTGITSITNFNNYSEKAGGPIIATSGCPVHDGFIVIERGKAAEAGTTSRLRQPKPKNPKSPKDHHS